MSTLLIVIHVIASLALILIVLLQTGKGADMGATFGGGSSQTLFGSSGASTFLNKGTAFVAIIFMITCISLAYLSGSGKNISIMDKTADPVEQTAEKVPGAADTTDSAGTTDNVGTAPKEAAQPAATDAKTE